MWAFIAGISIGFIIGCLAGFVLFVKADAHDIVKKSVEKKMKDGETDEAD